MNIASLNSQVVLNSMSIEQQLQQLQTDQQATQQGAEQAKGSQIDVNA
jgi:hypothetical protein